MPTTQDIIQRFRVTGDDSATAAFKNIAQAGSAAFSALGNAVGKLTAPLRKADVDLAQVERRADTFGRSINRAANQIASAATRVTGATAGLTAAGGAMLRGVLNISTALKSVQAGLIEQRLAASQATAETKRAITTDFSHANAMEDLRLAFAKGKIGMNEYVEQLQELRRTQARQVEQQRILENEAERLREEQAKAMEDAQKRAVIIKLEAQYGGALAAVLVNMANVLDSVRQRFLGAFGPRIAELLTTVVQSISNAAPQIFAIFDTMAKQIEAAFKASGLSIDSVIKGIVQFAADVAKIITTIVIPAFTAFMGVLQSIATFINTIFGTNFTGSTILAAAVVLKITGIFGALVGVVKLVIAGVGLLTAAFSPLGIAIAAVVAAIVLLAPIIAKIDWAGFAKTATDAWNSIMGVIGTVAEAIKSTWTGVVKFFQDAINSIIGFFNDLIKKVKEFLGLTGSTGGGSMANALGAGDIGGMARGGLFRGRRKGVDTNLAWLTDQEYIINPRATKFWGTDFLGAINRMVNPIRGFAEGGLNSITSPMPRVAFAGGSSGRATSRPLTLVIGDQEFGGLTVEDNTAENMARYATRRGVRSAGRRPLWFGGGR